MVVNVFSLKFRIALIVFVLEVILLTFVLGKTLEFVETNAIEDMKHRQNVITELVKNVSTDALFSEEYDDLQLQVSLISHNEEIDWIAVTNLMGVILSHSDFTLVGSKSTVSEKNKKTLTKVIKVDDFGKIEIEFSYKKLEQRIIDARHLGIYIALSGISIIAVASILFGHLLTRKLSSLSTAMETFQKDNKYVDIKLKGRDEISKLAEQFAVLTKKANSHIDMIEDEKNHLESRVIERTKELEHLNAELKSLASTDHMTGLSNRGYLEKMFHRELLRYIRNKNNIFSIILIDVDRFKDINDNFGHDVGDMILIDIAKVLRNNIRETDIVGRWGGEEFMLICSDTGEYNCEKVAEKLRIRIEDYSFSDVEKITCSFGVATILEGDTIESIFKRADLGLYKAKETGRNRVVNISNFDSLS